MNYLNKFDEENIHLFDLTAMGQESYHVIGDKIHLSLPFYKLGYFPEKLEYAFHMGYLIFQDINGYTVERIPYSNHYLDYNNILRYNFQHKKNKSEKSILLDTIAFHFNQLINFSINIEYSSLHLIYDREDYDCSPTKFSELPFQENISKFLNNENLEWISAMRHFITNKMG